MKGKNSALLKEKPKQFLNSLSAGFLYIYMICNKEWLIAMRNINANQNKKLMNIFSKTYVEKRKLWEQRILRRYTKESFKMK